MNSKIFYVVLGCVVLSLFVFAGAAGVVYMAMGILGPRDKPLFENKDWKKLHVRYELAVSKNESIAREFSLQGEELNALKQTLKTKDVTGMSLAYGGYIGLTCEDGDRWAVTLGAPNELILCKAQDKYYTYIVTLENLDFYEKLREICLQHERQFTPHAEAENIRLCEQTMQELREIVRPLHEDD